MARNIKLKLLTASCALCIHGTFVCVVVAVWLQFVSVAAADSSTGAAAANSVHTTTLAQPTAWDRGYSWYPDQPGQYPDSKWDYYYSSGGLYDQAHQSAAQVFLIPLLQIVDT
jgi:hypothetical protein